MSDPSKEINEREFKELKALLKERIVGKYTVGSYTHPMFRQMDEWVKRYGPFILRNSNQPADLNGFMLAQGGTTKMPADTSIGSLSMNIKNDNKQNKV